MATLDELNLNIDNLNKLINSIKPSGSMKTIVDVGNVTASMTKTILDKARSSKNQASEDLANTNEALEQAKKKAADAQSSYEAEKLQLRLAEEELTQLLTTAEASRVLKLRPAHGELLDSRSATAYNDEQAVKKYTKYLTQLRETVHDKKTQADKEAITAAIQANAAYDAEQALIAAKFDVAKAETENQQAEMALKTMQNPNKGKLIVKLGGRRRTNKKRSTRRKKKRGKKTKR
jgi:hypothetical protein